MVDARGCLLLSRFKRPLLLLEAMTHSSYMETSHVACYQRLEFLGDALIDWIITRHFFESHKGMHRVFLAGLQAAIFSRAMKRCS
jgi:endoribonuclease Dicer